VFSFGEYSLVTVGLAIVWGVFWVWLGINKIIGKQAVWELPPVWVRLLSGGPILLSLAIFAAPMWIRHGLWEPGTAGIAAGCLGTVVLLGMALYASTVLTRTLVVHRPGRRHSPVVAIGPYGVIRHPTYVLTVLAAWANALTFGRPLALIAALAITLCYLGLAVWEERNLSGQEGSPYPQYRSRVPMVVPRLRFGHSPEPAAPSGPPVSSRTLFEKRQPRRAAPGRKG
jgi:protein-S-isoprenylcysteine O-methyltransferase Ste14